MVDVPDKDCEAPRAVFLAENGDHDETVRAGHSTEFGPLAGHGANHAPNGRF